MFELILVADWSSRTVPSPKREMADAIWLCAGLDGAQNVEYHRTRAEALASIDGWLAQGHRTLLGFDFAFGYPRDFAERLTGRAEALAVWDWLADWIKDGPDNANNRFEVAAEIDRAFPGVGPPWGRPSGRDLPERGSTRHGHGIPDRRVVNTLAGGAQSVLKLFTTGSVSGQSLGGLAALAGLRRRYGLRVWPTETGFALPGQGNLLVEVFPSLFPPAPHPIRDAGQVIARARALRNTRPDWFVGPGDDPDAARIVVEEGWLLGVGMNVPLMRDDGFEASVVPGGSPDGTDCFALPPGVNWTSVGTALATLRDACPVVGGVEMVPVGNAAGRVLAEDLVARRSNPPAANAAVDGWGFAHATLRSAPVPIAAGRAAAGRPHDGAVPAGHALRILTGAELPAGVDTVALQEHPVHRGWRAESAQAPPGPERTRGRRERMSRRAALFSRQGRSCDPPTLPLRWRPGTARSRCAAGCGSACSPWGTRSCRRGPQTAFLTRTARCFSPCLRGGGWRQST